MLMLKKHYKDAHTGQRQALSLDASSEKEEQTTALMSGERRLAQKKAKEFLMKLSRVAVSTLSTNTGSASSKQTSPLSRKSGQTATKPFAPLSSKTGGPGSYKPTLVPNGPDKGAIVNPSKLKSVWPSAMLCRVFCYKIWSYVGCEL